MTNGRNTKMMNRKKKYEKLTEIFRKQWSAAKEIKTWTAKNLCYIYINFSNFKVGLARKTID